MKTARMLAWILATLLAGSPAMGEFYRYTDEQGNVVYTDDLSKVPREQHNQVQTYEAPAPRSTPPADTTPQSADAAAAEMDDLEAERERLEALEEALNQEYEALLQERDALDEEQEEAVGAAAIDALNSKIETFNARTQAYEEKRDDFGRQVKAFNERVADERSQ